MSCGLLLNRFIFLSFITLTHAFCKILAIPPSLGAIHQRKGALSVCAGVPKCFEVLLLTGEAFPTYPGVNLCFASLGYQRLDIWELQLPKSSRLGCLGVRGVVVGKSNFPPPCSSLDVQNRGQDRR